VWTILVVDDEFDLADVLAATLQEAGYRVLTAANGRGGLERLAENELDLVISDFMMPLMDGAQMAHAMRANPAHQDIPIIMMSAAAEAAVRKRFDGYRAFLRKPFPMPVLLGLIQEILDDGQRR
jgi:CheY-like chemotaxis protein